MCCQMQNRFHDEQSETPAYAFLAKVSEQHSQSHEYRGKGTEKIEKSEEKNLFFKQLQRIREAHIEAAQHPVDNKGPKDF